MKTRKLRKNKYGNKRVVYNGVTFDSEKEVNRFIYLSTLLESNVIANLVYHKNRYELLPKITHNETEHLKTKDKIITKTDQRAVYYEPDFEYDIVENNQHVIEDVKPSPKMIPADFKIKAKLFFWRYKKKISLVFEATEPIKIEKEIVDYQTSIDFE